MQFTTNQQNLYEIEIQVKKNFSNSLNIISDFILNKSIKSNNLSL